MIDYFFSKLVELVNAFVGGNARSELEFLRGLPIPPSKGTTPLYLYSIRASAFILTNRQVPNGLLGGVGGSAA